MMVMKMDFTAKIDAKRWTIFKLGKLVALYSGRCSGLPKTVITEMVCALIWKYLPKLQAESYLLFAED